MVTAGFTVTDSDCELLMAPAESVTLTENPYGVGVVTTGAVPSSEGPRTVSHAGRLTPFHVSGGVPPLAPRDCEYGKPDVIAGSEAVVTAGTALIGKVNVFVVEEPRLSVALIVNWNEPAEGGVPLSTLPVKASQEGSVCPESANVYGDVPPLAASVTVNGRVAVHGPSDAPVVMITPELTVTLKDWEPEEAPSESVAVAVKLYVVGCVTVGAVPLRVAPFWVSQDGRAPNVQVIAPVPPVAVNVCEYAIPAPAEASGLVVVMVSPGLTVTDRGCAALAAAVLSVTVTEKL
jgi:hypothetical protein